MDYPLKIVTAAGLVLGLTAALAAAHSWYPPECCHDVDCAPVELDLQDSSRGWFGAAATRHLKCRYNRHSGRLSWPGHSKDHRMHICITYDEFGGRALLCWFVPPST